MFLPYIHYVRSVAIILIVSSHMIRLFEWSSNEICEIFLKTFLMNGTVLFVFVSGYLFQYLSDRYTYRRYILSKLRNVILPYIIISLPIVIYLVFVDKVDHWANPGLTERSVIYQIYWYYISGKHLAPLWFIPMITILYLLYPAFRFIDKNSHLYPYILPIALIVAALSHRPVSEISIPHTLLYFSPVYLFGMFCSHNRSRFLLLTEKYQNLLFLSFLLIFTVEMTFYHHHGIIYVKSLFSHDKELVDINLFQKLILCLLLISVFVRFDTQIKLSRVEPVLNMVAVFSFGIYFLHYYFCEFFIRLIRIFKIHINGSILNVTSAALLVLLMCILFIKTLKFVLGKQSRLIIGC